MSTRGILDVKSVAIDRVNVTSGTLVATLHGHEFDQQSRATQSLLYQLGRRGVTPLDAAWTSVAGGTIEHDVDPSFVMECIDSSHRGSVTETIQYANPDGNPVYAGTPGTTGFSILPPGVNTTVYYDTQNDGIADMMQVHAIETTIATDASGSSEVATRMDQTTMYLDLAGNGVFSVAMSEFTRETSAATSGVARTFLNYTTGA